MKDNSVKKLQHREKTVLKSKTDWINTLLFDHLQNSTWNVMFQMDNFSKITIRKLAHRNSKMKIMKSQVENWVLWKLKTHKAYLCLFFTLNFFFHFLFLHDHFHWCPRLGYHHAHEPSFRWQGKPLLPLGFWALEISRSQLSNAQGFKLKFPTVASIEMSFFWFLESNFEMSHSQILPVLFFYLGGFLVISLIWVSKCTHTSGQNAIQKFPYQVPGAWRI